VETFFFNGKSAQHNLKCVLELSVFKIPKRVISRFRLFEDS